MVDESPLRNEFESFRIVPIVNPLCSLMNEWTKWCFTLFGIVTKRREMEILAYFPAFQAVIHFLRVSYRSFSSITIEFMDFWSGKWKRRLYLLRNFPATHSCKSSVRSRMQYIIRWSMKFQFRDDSGPYSKDGIHRQCGKSLWHLSDSS